MMALQGLFLASGFNISMTTLFIPLMASHMDSLDLTTAKKDQLAMLAMVSVGIGEILGSLVFGRIQDKQTIKAVVLANLAMLLLAMSVMLAFHRASEFNFWLASLMTLSWGFQDAGNSCCIYCMLGF